MASVLATIPDRAKSRARAALDRLGDGRWSRYDDPRALGHDHFRWRSRTDHVNYESLCDLLARMGGRPQTIIETGMSAWGTDSTRLFDSYVRSFGGRLWSVDIDRERVEGMRRRVSAATTLACDDSVAFLAHWVAEHAGESADIVYLDSWDVDFAAPLPAAEHCLREVDALSPAMRSGTLLLIDDSPGSLADVPAAAQGSAPAIFAHYGAWPGKGMLVQAHLAERGILPVSHGYQALYQL